MVDSEPPVRVTRGAWPDFPLPSTNTSTSALGGADGSGREMPGTTDFPSFGTGIGTMPNSTSSTWSAGQRNRSWNR